MRVSLARFLLRLGALVQSLAAMVMKPDDLVPPFRKLHEQMNRLAELTDLVYVHIDMDVLDPAEVSGHPLAVAGGPSSQALAGALEALFSHRQAAGLGIASYPAARDQGKLSLKAAYALVAGAIWGVRQIPPRKNHDDSGTNIFSHHGEILPQTRADIKTATRAEIGDRLVREFVTRGLRREHNCATRHLS
jgi:hypothetical protein